MLSSRVQGSGLGCVQTSLVAKVGGEGLGQRYHGTGGAQTLLVSVRTRTFRASLTHYSPKDEDLGASSYLYTDLSPPPQLPPNFPLKCGLSLEWYLNVLLASSFLQLMPIHRSQLFTVASNLSISLKLRCQRL